MLRHLRPIRTCVALGIVAAWALLLGVHLVDAIEDGDEGPEPVDVQVAQVLVTPSVLPTGLERPVPRASVPMASEPIMVDGLRVLFMSAASSSRIRQPAPPPRAGPRLFQTLSNYRL